MGISSCLQWKFMITAAMSGLTASHYPGVARDMPQLPPSTPAFFTRTPDNTCSIDMCTSS